MEVECPLKSNYNNTIYAIQYDSNDQIFWNNMQYFTSWLPTTILCVDNGSHRLGCTASNSLKDSRHGFKAVKIPALEYAVWELTNILYAWTYKHSRLPACTTTPIPKRLAFIRLKVIIAVPVTDCASLTAPWQFISLATSLCRQHLLWWKLVPWRHFPVCHYIHGITRPSSAECTLHLNAQGV